MSKRHPSREIRDLYHAYLHKPLHPETALEIATGFVLDLINVFGDGLDEATPLKEDWVQFAPFEFILYLNFVLSRYKELGEERYHQLSESDRVILADNHVLLEALVRSAVTSHPDSYPGEEHYQLPKEVLEDLFALFE